MIPTTYYMERTAAMPTAAPMGAVGHGHRYGVDCSMTSPAATRAAFANAGNAVKPGALWIGRQVGLTTDRRTRHLGRPST